MVQIRGMSGYSKDTSSFKPQKLNKMGTAQVKPTTNHHERFKLFRTERGNYAEVEKFLNTEKINPKSISITTLGEGVKSLVSIGYEVADAAHKFHLVTRSINITSDEIDTNSTAQMIENLAAQLDGVICQDIVYAKRTLIVTFLTTK